MSDHKCASTLLDAAERDIEALRVMLHPGQVSDEIFGFHVQQAAEKALKARVAVLGESYPLVHDVAALLNFLATRGVHVEGYQDLAEYTPFAVAFRYDGVGSDMDSIDRKEALALVEALLKDVRGELEEKPAT